MTWQIQQGDCRELMAAMPVGSVDCMITSPPYNVGMEYEPIKLSKPEQARFSREWLTEAYRVANEGTRLYIVVSDDLFFVLRPIAEHVGWRWVQMLIWCKTNLIGTARITGDWNRLSEPIMLLRKGKRTPMLADSTITTHNWILAASCQSNWVREKKQHVAQFPVQLVEHILKRTPGKIVLDPFCGSGSTGIAAVRLGRDFYGMDLSEKYVAMAKRRIAQEAAHANTVEIAQEVGEAQIGLGI